jgi:5-(carboxyamino)imidazole ribonucleotide mutase
MAVHEARTTAPRRYMRDPGRMVNCILEKPPAADMIGAVKGSRGKPLVGVVMGSKSDWAVLQSAAAVLGDLGIPHECRVVSAHRTPDLMARYARAAGRRGLRAIIAGAGGAAHLPGMLAAHTTVPVLGVPVPTGALQGFDALLSIVQMPGGVPVATFSIGAAGAKNAALFAAALLAPGDAALGRRLAAFRAAQSREAAQSVLPPA